MPVRDQVSLPDAKIPSGQDVQRYVDEAQASDVLC